MTLRLALNATPLLGPRTGIGNYVLELGRALAQASDIEAYSFCGTSWSKGLLAIDDDDEPPRARPALRRVLNAVVPFKRELRALQQRIAFERGLERHGIELYHEPNYVPVSYAVPVVVTIHDLSWIRFPGTHPPERVRWLSRNVSHALRRAAAVLVDSEFVKQEVLQEFSVPAEHLHVAHLGVSSAFAPYGADETAPTLRALGIVHKQYVLCLGTIEPRKNIEHVLAAYADLEPALRTRFPLVIAGAAGWRSGALERRLRELASRNEIRFAGQVDAIALRHLYAGAALFVFPSLYEGFGLPPLEAMASGTPVLVSSRASLPEVVGDAGVTLDPEDVEGTSACMTRLLEDGALRADYARRGLERARRFSWAKCAATTMSAYRAALARR